MDLKTIDLELTELPKTLDVLFDLESNINDVIEAVKGQIVYNSRFSEEAPAREPKVEVLSKSEKSVRLSISK